MANNAQPKLARPAGLLAVEVATVALSGNSRPIGRAPGESGSHFLRIFSEKADKRRLCIATQTRQQRIRRSSYCSFCDSSSSLALA